MIFTDNVPDAISGIAFAVQRLGFHLTQFDSSGAAGTVEASA